RLRYPVADGAGVRRPPRSRTGWPLRPLRVFAALRRVSLPPPPPPRRLPRRGSCLRLSARRARRRGDRAAGHAHVRARRGLPAHLGAGGLRPAAGDPLVRPRDGGESRRGLRARPRRERDHGGPACRRPREVGRAIPAAGVSSDADARFRLAAGAYLVYGVVYWLGGAWLWLHDVGRGTPASLLWIAVVAGAVGAVPDVLRRRR